MNYHDFEQGSPEWHAHRTTHFNASDAPAMLGVGTYETRTELLHRLATGVAPDIDAATQRRFDDGHLFEALARPLAVKIIGAKLYPVVGSEGKLSASFDGLTMDETICFEHKTLNDKLRNIQSSDDLPAQYHAQIEQQLMVSGANKCLFMASKWDGDELVEEVHIWVTHNQDMSNALAQGWTQFAIDLAEYKRRLAAGEIEAAKVEVIAAPIRDLPAITYKLNGLSLKTNLHEDVKPAILALVERVNNPLESDQDFVDLDALCKKFAEAEKQCELVSSQVDAEFHDPDQFKKDLKELQQIMAAARITGTKRVDAEKARIRAEIVQAAGIAFSAHMESLEAETRPIQLTVARPDFAAAIKGKRTIASLRDAVDTALANGKIAADAIAKDVRAKLVWCKETSAGYGFLFSDLAQIISKPMDDFQLVITSRIEKHKADEAARIEAETARIQTEATAKAEREAAAKLAQEEARIRAEEQAKARAEAVAEAMALKNREEQFQAEQVAMAQAQAEENALVAKQCGAEAESVDCSKPAKILPTRLAVIELVAENYNVSLSLAEEWLCAEFAEVTA